jgi:uncharacterized protein with FMN-binding domain
LASEEKKPSRRVSSGLVALSSAAVLTVYAAGYLRTRSAAQQFDGEALERRLAAPVTMRPVAPAVSPSAVESVPATNPVSAERSAPAVSPERDPRSADRTTPSATTTRESAEVREARSVAASSDVASDATTTAPAASQPPAAPLAASSQPGAELLASEGSHRTELAAPPIPKTQYKDGTYTGWGTSRHGDIQASVVIEGGRIISATIAQCLTRYSCSWIAPLPPEVVARQSAEVDYVSGATESTNAFYYGVIEALGKAK